MLLTAFPPQSCYSDLLWLGEGKGLHVSISRKQEPPRKEVSGMARGA